MPVWLHIILAIAVTVFCLFRFIKDKQIYEILLAVWAPSTLLQYLSADPVFLRVLGIFQVIMFILVVFFMFRRRGDRRRKTAQILANFATGDLDAAMGTEKQDSSEDSKPLEESSADQEIEK